MEKADSVNLRLTVDENGNPVVKPTADTGHISLELILGEDGSIAVKNAADITPRLSGIGPQNGDGSGLLIWSMMILLSGSMLFLLLVIRKQKRMK